ncbi:MAG: gliding motility-associated ABC transporter substrate-binding protein GldG [Bacteroidales bacterium]|nr:gliding motility-associated ABC transporter substrate-binding protein GldG [Bacteroidales bacterium]
MYTLFKKELSSFFSSLTGYITIIVFLVLTGLMLWVLKSDFNILDYGYAGMDGLFLIGPFLYLFLIPAITMRTFAEEKRVGTIEMLLTKPISDLTLIGAKFLAAFTLVVISLLPTLVCYLSVVALGDPVGNIDSGSVAGSYIGLILLGGAFVAIGLFASSITGNQIVSFIVAALLCVVAYLGFESVYNMGILGKADLFVKSLGMMHHYESISRGVIDTRDVLYFLSVIILFLIATRLVLQSRKWNGWVNRRKMKYSQWLEIAAVVAIVASANVIGHYLFARLDLTAEKRYTLSKATKSMLRNVDEPVLFRVYLEGDFPADFKRLQSETKEMLNQFRAYNENIQYEFVNPNNFNNKEEQQIFYQKLANKGIQPTQIQVGSGSSVTTQILIPAADVIYRGRETSIQLLQNQKYVSEADLLNNSIQNLEYVLSNAIRALARGVKPSIGFVQGHGELMGGQLYDIQMALQEYYSLDYVSIDGNINALTGRSKTSSDSNKYSFYNKFDLLIIAKPTLPFSDQDLYIIDQYIMRGGRVLWLIDPLNADIDSLAAHAQAIATRMPLNLDEMLFNYGARVNPNIIMDIRCRPIPMRVGMVGDKPQIKFCPWYYFPEIVPTSQHPIVRNLDLIKTDFVSSIDLLDNSDDIRASVLLTTSEYSRIKNAPAVIDLGDGQVEPDRRLFNRSNLPIAVLLEGCFKSTWRNRLTPQFTELPEMGYLAESAPTKMIIVSDGDIIKNRYNAQEGSAYPMGYDFYTQTLYANKEFLLNAVNYLVGDEGMLASRSRDIKLRKLDVMKVHEQRNKYQVINVILPSAVIALAGVAIYFVRKKKYCKPQ